MLHRIEKASPESVGLAFRLSVPPVHGWNILGLTPPKKAPSAAREARYNAPMETLLNNANDGAAPSSAPADVLLFPTMADALVYRKRMASANPKGLVGVAIGTFETDLPPQSRD